MAEHRACETCRYSFENGLHHGIEYQCRYRAPKVFQEPVGIVDGREIIRPVTRWPVVGSSDCCGRYDERGR